jgi:ABC-type antimicrobial peptide transport system permease subunit
LDSKKKDISPPVLPLKLLKWLCKPEYHSDIEGDLLELYHRRVGAGQRRAGILLFKDVILLLRPGIIRPLAQHENLNMNGMYKSYFKIGWRNLLRNKGYSSINIGGLAIGMAVAMLIGLWIYDELSFEKYHKNYDRIVQVLEHSNLGGGITTQSSLPMPVSAELRSNFGDDFDQVASTLLLEQNIVYGDKAFSKVGCYAEAGFTEILTLDMLKGTRTALKDPGTILLSESLATAIFGDTDPINKIVILNNVYSLQVAGIYEDLPQNTSFTDMNFIARVDLLFQSGQSMDNWYSSSFKIYALMNSGSRPEQVSSRIKNVFYQHTKDATKPALFLHPMHLWHLYEFKDGNIIPGRLQFVWLFGIIGMFVLTLACINFMNLSTARSEKRSKEVGIRKTMGSLRTQLIFQFFSESFLVVLVSLAVSFLLVWLAIPWFNSVSGKQLKILWDNPAMWLSGLMFCLITGLIAGSYPAIYLSSFSPVKVLKGPTRAGRFAAGPRKLMVIVQFIVSVTLITGTLIVFKQIEFAKNRPIGYNRSSLLTIPYNSLSLQSYNAFRNELLETNAVVDVAASSSPMTGIWAGADNLDWKGKDPNRQEMFGTILIDPDYGNVTGWEVKEGRTFSREFPSDSAGFIFNEAAIAKMGLAEPLGEIVKWHGKDWKIIGVVKDMVMSSPFDPVTPIVFLMDNKERSFNIIHLKLNTTVPVPVALNKIEAVFKTFVPASPLNYRFTDQEYAFKFAAEERIGKLASIFATLAILISCSGLFGLSSFMAEQRTKEIGIRKVLGASVFKLWEMLCKDFLLLVTISCITSVPIAWYFMNNWLERYEYRTEISWWIFVSTCAGALSITLLTVSFQAIKAASVNPVTSLRSE